MVQIVDAASRIYGPDLANTRYVGISRYLSDGGSTIPDKLLLPDEAKSYLDAGLTLVSNWETTSDRMKGGYSAGYEDVRKAWAVHKECGGPDNAVIYYSADFDATPDDQTQINAYLEACIEYTGVQCVGVYGSYYVVQRVHEWNPHVYLWQTLAWSGGQIYTDAHLYQTGGQDNIAGNEVDIDTVMRDDYGQWNLHLGDEMGPVTSLVDKQEYTAEQMVGFIDYHTWRTDKLMTAIAAKQGIDTSDTALEMNSGTSTSNNPQG